MKKFLVVLLACALIFGFAATASAADTQIKEFSDIADQSQAAQNAIMKLAVLGVVEGNEGIGGSFRPADNLTRAEFAKIVCYLTGNVKAAESLANVGSKFSDVSTGNWYTGWVNMAAQSGYFVGDPGGTFRPNANITMNEVVTVALRAAGYNDKLPGTWPGNYALKAQNVGLLDDVTFVGSAAATRADMSLICSEVLGINMVVHISNEIAYALALSDGTVDVDGFSETYYVSNETSLKLEETILHKAFDGQYYYLLVNQTERPVSNRINDEPKAEYFDESNGWAYEDYDDGEITINIYDSISYEDDDFDDYYTTSSNNSTTARKYNVADSLASTYYLAGNYELTDLSGMQVQVLVIDGKEINYVEPYSSYVLAKSVYRNSASNIVADGKTYRASTTMDVGGKVSDKVYDADVKAVIDLTEGAFYGGTTADDAIQNLYDSDSDNDFPGKIYLDKEGRVYAVKNYNAYNEIPFGIVDEVDSGEAVLKAQTTNWKTTGSTGGNTNYTLDTDEPYVLYKDGELIKAEDLAENDVLTYLGDNGGHFYYVISPTEGDFTQQTSSKMTVSGYGYRQVADFHISDDGGEDFDKYLGFGTDPVDTASFGEVEIAIAYNFSRIDYIALNTTANKVIGVVTDADPDSVWDSGGFNPQYKTLTIYNSEGKEVKYTFTTNFRNAYNYKLAKELSVPTAVYSSSSSSSAAGKFESEHFNATKSLEVLTGPIKEGDIVELTLDKSDNIKKLSNYAAFDVAASDGDVEAAVKASTNRITIKKNKQANENGTYTLPSDAIVFNVTADGKEYDDVSIKTVASTLAADFDAMKIVAFDTKTNGNINYLYIQEGVSAYKFGIISGQGRDATDDYYTINGQRVYSDGIRARNVPNMVSYQISGGDATISGKTFDGYLAWLSDSTVYYLTDMDALVKDMDADYSAVYGTVKSYSSSTNALNVGDQMLYITSDSYLYDLAADDDISSAASLRDKFVAVIYDDDFEVVCVALLAENYTTATNNNKLVGYASTADTRTDAQRQLDGYSIDEAVAGGTVGAWKASIMASNTTDGTITVTIADGSGNALADDIVLVNGNSYAVTIRVVAADATIATSTKTVTVRNVGSNVGITGIALDDVTATVSSDNRVWNVAMPAGTNLTPLLATDVVVATADGNAEAVVARDSDNKYTITVTAEDGTTTATYTLNVTVAASSNVGITSIVVDGIAAAVDNSDDRVYRVTLPYGTDRNSVAAGSVSITASAGTAATPVKVGTGESWTVLLTSADSSTTATYTIYVDVATGIAYDSMAVYTDAVSAEYGDVEATAKGLLDATVEITGTLGETYTASITWTIDSYDGDVAGEYTATGVLSKPSSWTGVPDITATVTVKRLAKAPVSMVLATGATNPLPITLNISYVASTLLYPDATAATFGDGATENIKLNVEKDTGTNITIAISGTSTASGPYTAGADLDVVGAGTVIFTVTVTETGCTDRVYVVTVTVT